MKNDWTLRVVVPTIIFTVWSVVESQDCNKTEELMKCVQPMRVLTDDNDFGFVMNKEELDRMCPDLRHGIRCINDYTLRCMTEEKRAHFNKLYEGTTQVIQKLCTPGAYQEEFLHHAPCMKEVTTDYEDCAHKYQQKIGEVHARISEHNNKTSADISGREKELRTVCCSFRDYLLCSQRIVMNKCGEDTAKFTEDFLNQMSFSLIQADSSGRWQYVAGLPDSDVSFLSQTGVIFAALSS
ncbi:uncharacterized protein [Periplaneta americana]|uniref:uncharacterized protein isoform X2 n=1 Tax=Periplaneta americana TaxID=6978 RepID=UPI0037E961A0